MKILKGSQLYTVEYKKFNEDKKIDFQIISTSYVFAFVEKEGRIVLVTVDDEKYWKLNQIRKLFSRESQFDVANVIVTVKGEEMVVQSIEGEKSVYFG